MRKSFSAVALTAFAMASATGVAGAAPIPAGPQAVTRLTGMILPGPDQVTGSDVDTGDPMLELEDTNLVNVLSDHSRTQTNSSGNQG